MLLRIQTDRFPLETGKLGELFQVKPIIMGNSLVFLKKSFFPSQARLACLGNKTFSTFSSFQSTFLSSPLPY